MINELDVGDIVELEKGYIGIVCLSNVGLFTYVTTEDRFIISYFSNSKETYQGWDEFDYSKIKAVYKVHPDYAASITHDSWFDLKETGYVKEVYASKRTIIIEGKEIEISEESFQELRKSLV